MINHKAVSILRQLAQQKEYGYGLAGIDELVLLWKYREQLHKMTLGLDSDNVHELYPELKPIVKE